MGDVIDINSKKDNPTNLKCQQCGGEWFDLVRRIDPSTPIVGGTLLRSVPGSVVLDKDFRVVGYSGTPVCHDCKKPV